ncbi:MAG: tetratricopeptide repeat protein [Phycisphaeraceae bacterium]|nr:tetratricopeptide repeat protein [Phycisphaeraceae bacterium]
MPRRRMESLSRVTLALLVAPMLPLPGGRPMVSTALAAAGAGQPESAQPQGPTQAEADRLFQQQKYAEAAAMYEQIVEREPENPTAWFNLGYSLHITGQLERALVAHEKAAEIAPTAQLRGPAVYNIGCANALLGRKDAAFAALVRAVDAGFTNTQLIQQDSDLDSLRDDPRFEEIQTRVQQRALPIAFRQFNFWVGKWDVYNQAGQRVGGNRITLEEGGLFLQERWVSGNGGSGQSINYFEPVGRVWKQVWIDSQGVLETSGTFEDGAMRFRGERKLRSGRTKQQKMVFTPLPDGRVRQYIEESDDGETWTVYFDGLYVPAGSEAPGAWTPESLTEQPEAEEGGADAGRHAGVLAGLVGLWDLSASAGNIDEAAIEALIAFEMDGGDVTGFLELDNERVPLEDIAHDGETLTMRLTAPTGDVYRFRGEVTGDTMRGVWTGPNGLELNSRASRRVL